MKNDHFGKQTRTQHYSFFLFAMISFANSMNSSALQAQPIKGSSSNSFAVARFSGYTSLSSSATTSTFKARDKNALNVSLHFSGSHTVGAGLV